MTMTRSESRWQAKRRLNSLGISAKIWLGISLLIGGFALSTILGFQQTTLQGRTVQCLSDEVFPATQTCQSTIAEFGLQTKLYQDSVMMGEAELIEAASSRGETVLQGLRAVADYRNLGEETCEAASALAADIETFTRDAGRVYGAMANMEMTPATQAEATRLAGTQTEIEARLLALKDASSQTLLDGLAAMADGSRRQINISLIVFFAMVAASGALIWTIVNRGIVRSLKRAVHLADTVGRGDLSLRLNQDDGDEIGQLAQALDAMADGLEEKALVAEAIAGGDLTRDVDVASQKDRFGTSLAGMVQNLRRTIRLVQDSSQRVTEGADLISNSSTSLSKDATNQAASLEEISSSSTEISDQTRQNAEAADKASRFTGQTTGSVEQGAAKMELLTEAMSGIATGSEEIAKIIKVIDDIAFQTNLLALNAAVEAARAGRHGKGFAVVAEEVRTLAGRSAKAARETADLIENSIKRVENGTTLTAETAAAFDEIREGVTETSKLMGMIAESSSQQALGINEISTGMKDLDSITQRNAAESQEMASAAGDLSYHAQELQRTLAAFRVGTSAAAPAEQSKPAAAAGINLAVEKFVPSGGGVEDSLVGW